MSEKENTKLVKQTYEYFKSGDIQSLLGLYDENIEWEVPESGHVAYGGKRTGRHSVEEFFTAVNNDMEPIEFEQKEFVAQGDKVVVIGRFCWRIRATGKEYTSDYVHVVTVTDGKITGFQEYMDTAAASEAHAPSAQSAGL